MKGMDVKLNYILIFAAGCAAGFLNTVGGGGSLITLPVLIFLGLPSAIANGTNRIALMAQNISAVAGFKRKGYFYPKLAIMLGIPAAIGSIIGSNFAVGLSDEMFNKILGIVMIIVLVLILTRPEKKFIKDTDIDNIDKRKLIIAMIAFFFVGLYGGFIQVGVGFIIIVSLSLITGMSLVKVNSIKVFTIGIYMISSLIVFISRGSVDWGLGLVLALGNSTGAYLGANFSVNKGEKWIRIIITCAVVVMAGKLWGLWL